MNNGKGIAFIELVIVMIVLTLFSSFIVPQIGQAAQESRISGMCRTLQDVRSYITIYKAQHKQKLPGQGDCNWENAMCGITDENGNKLINVSSDIMQLGPYMKKVPVNPYNGLSTIDFDGVPGDNSHGWHFDTKTGQFNADNSVEHWQL
jgi:Tfp pilus assembly protein PilE